LHTKLIVRASQIATFTTATAGYLLYHCLHTTGCNIQGLSHSLQLQRSPAQPSVQGPLHKRQRKSRVVARFHATYLQEWPLNGM